MKICCVIGHRTIKESKTLFELVEKNVVNLIEKENVTTFLFGSASQFTYFCYDVISGLKTRFPNIKRIYVRAEYPIISNEYYNHLKNFYEDSYFYSKKLLSNTFSYIRRDKFMIDKSDVCLFYYNANYLPNKKTKSGTCMAYEYALKKSKKTLNLYNENKNSAF